MGPIGKISLSASKTACFLYINNFTISFDFSAKISELIWGTIFSAKSTRSLVRDKEKQGGLLRFFIASVMLFIDLISNEKSSLKNNNCHDDWCCYQNVSKTYKKSLNKKSRHEQTGKCDVSRQLFRTTWFILGKLGFSVVSRKKNNHTANATDEPWYKWQTQKDNKTKTNAPRPGQTLSRE